MEETPHSVEQTDKTEITDPSVFVARYLQSDEFKEPYKQFHASFLASHSGEQFDESTIQRSFLGSKYAELGIKDFQAYSEDCRFTYTADSVSPQTAAAIKEYVEEIRAHNKEHRKGTIDDNQIAIAAHDHLRRQYHEAAANLVSAELVQKGVINNAGAESMPLGIGRGIVSLVAFQKLGSTNS